MSYINIYIYDKKYKDEENSHIQENCIYEKNFLTTGNAIPLLVLTAFWSTHNRKLQFTLIFPNVITGIVIRSLFECVYSCIFICDFYFSLSSVFRDVRQPVMEFHLKTVLPRPIFAPVLFPIKHNKDCANGAKSEGKCLSLCITIIKMHKTPLNFV